MSLQSYFPELQYNPIDFKILLIPLNAIQRVPAYFKSIAKRVFQVCIMLFHLERKYSYMICIYTVASINCSTPNAKRVTLCSLQDMVIGKKMRECILSTHLTYGKQNASARKGYKSKLETMQAWHPCHHTGFSQRHYTMYCIMYA